MEGAAQGCPRASRRVKPVHSGGRQPPTFLSQDGERVSVTIERKGSHALVKLETHDWSCTLPASAFVLERIAHKLKGQVNA